MKRRRRSVDTVRVSTVYFELSCHSSSRLPMLVTPTPVNHVHRPSSSPQSWSWVVQTNHGRGGKPGWMSNRSGAKFTTLLSATAGTTHLEVSYLLTYGPQWGSVEIGVAKGTPDGDQLGSFTIEGHYEKKARKDNEASLTASASQASLSRDTWRSLLLSSQRHRSSS